VKTKDKMVRPRNTHERVDIQTKAAAMGWRRMETVGHKMSHPGVNKNEI
jgi:hypothetical protein